MKAKRLLLGCMLAGPIWISCFGADSLVSPQPEKPRSPVSIVVQVEQAASAAFAADAERSRVQFTVSLRNESHRPVTIDKRALIVKVMPQSGKSVRPADAFGPPQIYRLGQSARNLVQLAPTELYGISQTATVAKNSGWSVIVTYKPTNSVESEAKELGTASVWEGNIAFTQSFTVEADGKIRLTGPGP